jgi:O-antigen biosynthesis protein WbqV
VDAADDLKRFYRGKRVLVTGAAGSVGSALAEQLTQFDCAHLALLDQYDHGLLEIVERVGRIKPSLEVAEILCDVRDRDRLASRFERIKPDIVVHAAALKHVHLGERHPSECILTNLIGTRNALAAASAAGASHFTLVSSDKAAAPVCVMGATKRLAELHLLGFKRECAPTMALKSVRFGNILGSQGSVVPRFAAQIAVGGPVEVTHPEMERFFMTSEEAIALILSVTAAQDDSGTYYMQMGETVFILDLARQMIAKSGQRIPIEFIGLRAGEKLKEALSDENEWVVDSGTPHVFRVTPMSDRAQLSSSDLDQLERVARTIDGAVVRQRVFALLDARLGRENLAVG